MKYQLRAGVITPFVQKYYKLLILAIAGLFTATTIAATLSVSAGSQQVWGQGFESDLSGWFDSSNGWYGTATQVASGTGGITSSAGSSHAIFEGDVDSAPFSRFDEYRDVWAPWTAEIDVYLDPSWTNGQGFDYSVAATGSDGNHQRDFIFHVTKDSTSSSLLVAGSNNTNFAPREDLENINHYEIKSAGWYTLQHVFSDVGGQLSVDLNLLDDSGTVLWTETRTSATDTIPAEVGGNRYAWFTFINVDGGIAVDEHQLFIEAYVGSKEECKKGGWELGLEDGTVFNNQGECVSHFASNGTSTAARNKNR